MYQVGINKGIILRCTAYQISRYTQKFDTNSLTSHLLCAKKDNSAILDLMLTISVFHYKMQCLYLPNGKEDASPLLRRSPHAGEQATELREVACPHRAAYPRFAALRITC